MTRPLVWSDREDVTEVLEDPSFWATFGRTSRGGGGPEFFEAPIDDTTFYDQLLMRRFEAGVWPFIRVSLDARRYVEVEFTDDHEERYWIGLADWRALLGYESSHASLPAFRPEELAWITDRLPDERRSFAFLLLKATYFPSAEPAAQRLISRLVEALPGLLEDRASELVAECLQDQVSEDVAWRRDPDLGWVCESVYAARRENGALSTLAPSDFPRIAEFFG